jgi:hypothetical protein
MTTVTGFTADRMLSIEAASVVDGDVDGNGNLILTKHDGSTINAGSVIGPTGPQGPVGSMLSVVSAKPVLDVGLVNQIRAGRQLSPADFAAIGLNAPSALWNLSDLSDVSGNGRNLQNKGAVPFTTGINGVATTAAQFVSSTAQCLYISDTGAADSFRLKTGSIGCWVRNPDRANARTLISKLGSGGASNLAYQFTFNATKMSFLISTDGTSWAVNQIGVSDVSDNRWHFVVAAFDGAMSRLYIDGILESTAFYNGVPFASSAPFNIGGYGGDSSTASSNPYAGLVDEAFVTSDVLSEDQVRALYCAKIPHMLTTVPTRVNLNVRRLKKGAAFVPSDFPTQPLRLYNFSAGSLGDQGSNNTPLTNANPNSVFSIAGADGSNNNGYQFIGTTHNGLQSTDSNLPSGTAVRSYGCWFKCGAQGPYGGLIGWGSGSNFTGVYVSHTAGSIMIRLAGISGDIQGPLVEDSQWHFMVVVEDPAPIDGLKFKWYLDGRCIFSSTQIGNIILGGVTFTFGLMSAPGGQVFQGSIDGGFVCNYALTAEQIRTLYVKGSQALSPSPKNVGDHVEGMDAANLYAIFDTLESQHQVDLAVA